MYVFSSKINGLRIELCFLQAELCNFYATSISELNWKIIIAFKQVSQKLSPSDNKSRLIAAEGHTVALWVEIVPLNSVPYSYSAY